MSEDPIGFKGKDFNLYRYVNNGPVNHRDPSGKLSTAELIFLGLIGIVCATRLVKYIEELIIKDSLNKIDQKPEDSSPKDPTPDSDPDSGNDQKR